MSRLEKGKEHSLKAWNRKLTKAQKQQENRGSLWKVSFWEGEIAVALRQ